MAGATAPIRTVGDSLPRGPLATWLLMDLAVRPGTWSMERMRSPVEAMIARAFCELWGVGVRSLDYMDAQDGRGF